MDTNAYNLYTDLLTSLRKDNSRDVLSLTKQQRKNPSGTNKMQLYKLQIIEDYLADVQKYLDDQLGEEE